MALGQDKGARTTTRSRRQFQRTAIGEGIVYGNGIAFDPDNGEISINLATDPALQFTTNALEIKIKADAGLEKDSDGIGIDLPSISGLMTNSTGLLIDLRDTDPGLELVASGVGVLLNPADSALELTSGLRVDSTVPRWRKFTLAFSDFSIANTVNDIELLDLPARGVIHAVKIKHQTAFSGGTISAYTVSVGITGTLDKYAGAFDVFQATGDTVFQLTDTIGSESDGSSTSIRAAATSTGDDLNNATAGSVDIWVLYSVPPA